MAQIIRTDDLVARPGATGRFDGHEHGATVSFFVVRQPEAGKGPGLHTHPYEEIFVITEGSATFTVDGETIEATAGMILIAPPGAPHKFVTGPDGLRSVNIHASERMIQVDLPDAES